MKKFFTAALILTALLCVGARAEVLGGDCGLNGGGNVKWILDFSSGELRIYGEGVMADYIKDYEPRPAWKEYSANIKSVVVEEGVTSIGESAFNGLTELKIVSLPESVRDIRSFAFAGSGVEYIDLHENKSEISDSVFYKSSLREITIPSGVTEIRASAFEDCALLEKVSLPEGLRIIGEAAFKGTALREIVLPDSVNELRFMAFSQCEYLTSADLGEGLTSIGNYAFSECSSLSRLKLPSKLKEIGMAAFSGCSALAEVNLPASLKIIGGSEMAWDLGAFSFCTSLAEITLSEGLTTIGGHAFCKTSIKTITIPDSVTELGAAAFRGCASLESVTLPNGLLRLNANMFDACTNLKAVDLPESLEEIGGDIIIGTACSEIYLPKNVRSVSMSFRGAPYLAAIRVDPDNAYFYDVDGVLFSREGPELIFYPGARPAYDYTVPEGTAVIGYAAFGKGSCIINTLRLPASVKKFDPGAFYGSDSPVRYDAAESNPVYSTVDGVLMNKNKTVLISYPSADPREEYTVPDGVTEIGEMAFSGAANLKKNHYT